MKMWHATQEENVEAILRDGLRQGTYPGGGVKPIWLAFQRHHALAFGNCLFEVTVNREVPKQKEWQICCYFDISTSDLKYHGRIKKVSEIDPLWQDKLSGICFTELR